MDETIIQSGNECIVDKESHQMKNSDNAQDDIVNDNSDNSDVKILETDEYKKENDKILESVIPKNNKIDVENRDNNDEKILVTDEYKKETDKILESVIPKNNKIDEENCNHNTSLEEINKHSERNEKNNDEIINKVLVTPNNCSENDVAMEDIQKSVNPIISDLNNSTGFNDTVTTTIFKSEEKGLKEEESDIIVSESVNQVKTIKKTKNGIGRTKSGRKNPRPNYPIITEEELQERYRSTRLGMEISNEERELLLEKVDLGDGTMANLYSVYKDKKSWLYLCHPCKINELRNVETLILHINGKSNKHNKLLKKVKNLKDRFAVRICRGKRLKCGLIEEKPNCTINKVLNKCFKPLIGLEYVVEFIQREEPKPCYLCLLCDFDGKSNKIIMHLKSQAHCSLYLKKFFPKAYEQLEAANVSEDNTYEKRMRHVIGRIQFVYGRLQPLQIRRTDLLDHWKKVVFDIVEGGFHFIENGKNDFTECVKATHLKLTVCEDSWKVRQRLKLIGVHNVDSSLINNLTSYVNEKQFPDNSLHFNRTWQRNNQYPRGNKNNFNPNVRKDVTASPSLRLTRTFFPLKDHGEIRTSLVPYLSNSQKRMLSNERLGPADVPTKIKKSQESHRSLESKPKYSYRKRIERRKRTHFWDKNMGCYLPIHEKDSYSFQENFGSQNNMAGETSPNKWPREREEWLNEPFLNTRTVTNLRNDKPVIDPIDVQLMMLNDEQRRFQDTRSSNHGIKDVIAVLRYVLVLENYLGYLGPKVHNLLSEALRIDKFSEECGDIFLSDVNNLVLLETVKEKLTALLEAGMIEQKFTETIEIGIHKLKLLISYGNNQVLSYARPKRNEILMDASPSTITSNFGELSSRRNQGSSYNSMNFAENSTLLNQDYGRAFPKFSNFREEPIHFNQSSLSEYSSLSNLDYDRPFHKSSNFREDQTHFNQNSSNYDTRFAGNSNFTGPSSNVSSRSSFYGSESKSRNDGYSKKFYM